MATDPRVRALVFWILKARSQPIQSGTNMSAEGKFLHYLRQHKRGALARQLTKELGTDEWHDYERFSGEHRHRFP